MNEVEIQRQIGEIQAEITRLKRRVETLSKQQGEMNEKQEQMNLDIKDTNRESHLAKHASLNVQANLASFMTLFEKNQKAIETNQESIRELTAAKRMTEEKVQRVLTWIDEFAELSTYKGWEEKFREISENTKFRQMFGSWYTGLLGMAAVFAAILAALAFSKKIGL